MGNKSRFTTHEKAEVVLHSLKSPESISEICRKYNVAPITFSRWKRKYLAAGLDAMMGANPEYYKKREKSHWNGFQAA
jgi:transposase-like protein